MSQSLHKYPVMKNKDGKCLQKQCFQTKNRSTRNMFYIQICIIRDSAVTPYLTIVFVLQASGIMKDFLRGKKI